MRDNIKNKCNSCTGSGYLLYGSTATWHGGIGGCAMTWDTCNQCWGSGDSTHPWINLKRLKAERMATAIAVQKLRKENFELRGNK